MPLAKTEAGTVKQVRRRDARLQRPAIGREVKNVAAYAVEEIVGGK